MLCYILYYFTTNRLIIVNRSQNPWSFVTTVAKQDRILDNPRLDPFNNYLFNFYGSIPNFYFIGKYQSRRTKIITSKKQDSKPLEHNYH